MGWGQWCEQGFWGVVGGGQNITLDPTYLSNYSYPLMIWCMTEFGKAAAALRATNF